MSGSPVESIVATGCRLANQMRMLNYNDWMKLVTTLFSNLMIILGRVRVLSVKCCSIDFVCTYDTGNISVDQSDLHVYCTKNHEQI